MQWCRRSFIHFKCTLNPSPNAKALQFSRKKEKIFHALFSLYSMGLECSNCNTVRFSIPVYLHSTKQSRNWSQTNFILSNRFDNLISLHALCFNSEVSRFQNGIQVLQLTYWGHQMQSHPVRTVLFLCARRMRFNVDPRKDGTAIDR